MAERRLSIEQNEMQLSTAVPKLGAVGYAEWRPAMRAALVVQRALAVVRDGVDFGLVSLFLAVCPVPQCLFGL